MSVSESESAALPARYTLAACGGMVPTQAEGRTADDRPFYFRARHGRWTLEVGEAGWPTDYTLWPHLDSIGERSWVVARGDDPTQGCMSRAEVEAVLRVHLPVTHQKASEQGASDV